MWSKTWNVTGVIAEIRSRRHEYVDQQVLALYMRIIKELFKSLYL